MLIGVGIGWFTFGRPPATYAPQQLPLVQAIVDTGVHPQQLFVTQQCEDQSEGLALSIGTTTYRVSEERYGATLIIEREGNGALGE